jgi:hypothetical protein
MVAIGERMKILFEDPMIELLPSGRKSLRVVCKLYDNNDVEIDCCVLDGWYTLAERNDLARKFASRTLQAQRQLSEQDKVSYDGRWASSIVIPDRELIDD